MAKREMLNCPNCGAPITAEKCQYCGAVFYDFSSIDTDTVNYIKIKHNGRVFICRALLLQQAVTVNPRYADYFMDDRPYFAVQLEPSMEMTLHFQIIPDDQNILYKSVEV